jgi:hypothetical protein
MWFLLTLQSFKMLPVGFKVMLPETYGTFVKIGHKFWFWDYKQIPPVNVEKHLTANFLTGICEFHLPAIAL